MTNRSHVSSEESEEAFNGLAVICDLCGHYLAPSNGGRFKCMICDDYDLCAACFAMGTHDNHAFVHMKNGETVMPDYNFGEIRGLNYNQQHNLHPILPNVQQDEETIRRDLILAEKNEEMEQKYAEIAEKFEKMKQERDELAARDEERERKYKKMLIMLGRNKQVQ